MNDDEICDCHEPECPWCAFGELFDLYDLILDELGATA